MHTNVVSFSNYFTTLRTDVAGGSADDIFWVSNAYLAGYADSGRPGGQHQGVLGRREPLPLMREAVEVESEQFTRGGTLWGVPQLTDAGIAVYYNADLLGAAGVDVADLTSLRWSPDGGDTLRPLLARLTEDADGRTAATPAGTTAELRQVRRTTQPTTRKASTSITLGSAGAQRSRPGDRFAIRQLRRRGGVPLLPRTS